MVLLTFYLLGPLAHLQQINSTRRALSFPEALVRSLRAAGYFPQPLCLFLAGEAIFACQ